MKILTGVCGCAVLCLLIWAFWFLEAGNIGDRSVVGTYTVEAGGDSYALVLKTDHTFRQDFLHQSKTEHVDGSWRLFGEAGIAFSPNFIKLPGQTMNSDGTAYGQIKNTFGIVSITLAPNPGGPILHKNWSH